MSDWKRPENLPKDYGPCLVCYRTTEFIASQVRFAVFFYSPKDGLWITDYVDRDNGLHAVVAGEETTILAWQKITPPLGILYGPRSDSSYDPNEDIKVSPDDIPDLLVRVLWKKLRYSSERAKELISEAFAYLTPREKYVITKRFGFFGSESRELQKLAKDFSVTRERIRQIETKVLAKIKRRVGIIVKNESNEKEE